MSTEDIRMIVYPGNTYAPDFTGLIGTNVPKGGVKTTIDNSGSLAAGADDAALQQNALAALVDSGSVVTQSEGSITVQPGTPALFGGVGNWQAGEIPGTSLWIQNPGGQYVNTPTSLNDPQQVVIVPQQSSVENAVLAFVIPNPAPGVWSFGLNYDQNNASSYLQYMVSTIPTGGMETMIEQYHSMYEIGHPQGASLAQSVSDGWKCTVCKIITYPLALLVLAAGAGALTLVTTECALVTSILDLIALPLAPYITVTAAGVVAFLVGLGTAATLTVAFIIKEFCNWIHLCGE